MVGHSLRALTSFAKTLSPIEILGEVVSVQGLLIEVVGLNHYATIGSQCSIRSRHGDEIRAEVIAIQEQSIMLLSYQATEGIGLGCLVKWQEQQSSVFPDSSWQGRILNAFGDPIDENGLLMQGSKAYPLKAVPPPAQRRTRVHQKIDLGVRAVNSFITCCRGQRLGIFAGSGVGKSMLIAMMTSYSEADVKVIGLIGERGREVKEFIEDYLGPEGMKKAVIIVATSNESALMRRQAAYLTMAVAEFFRDQGKSVLCLMDSVTRFAMAQREIGLLAGEPPTSRGYTPSVFSELPQLLERAGPGVDEGSITGLFSVLVEGDDHNEPIADAVRGILDGHITLDRVIAERGRFPSINVLRSVSRLLPKCNSEAENRLITRARMLLSVYEDMGEMIRLGAYRKGSDKAIDEAIEYYPKIEAYLQQSVTEPSQFKEGYQQLAELLDMKEYYAAESSNSVRQDDKLSQNTAEAGAA